MSKGKDIDLGIAGITAYVLKEDAWCAVISLTRPRIMFDEPDRNTYRNGSLKRDPNKPGSVETQQFGLMVAGVSCVQHVRFNGNYGLFVRLGFHPDRVIPHLKRIANHILDAADAYEASHAATTNP